MQVLLLQKPHVKSKFQWWKHVLHLGPLHGYFPKAAKTCLIVKPELLDSSKAIYEGSGVQVIAHGQRHLGAVIRSRCFAEEYVMEKVQVWSEEIRTLSSFAQMHLHSACIHCFYSWGCLYCKWNFFMCTVQSIGHLLQPLEDVMHQFFDSCFVGEKSLL